MNLSIQNLILGVVNQFGGSPDINRINQFFKNKEYKFSSGIEIRLNGFSFYSYPTAIEYSYHIPYMTHLKDDYNPKQYLKILFNF